jgi:hypothetical protein
MTRILALLLVSACLVRADVTITQKTEGPGLPGTEMKLKFKGNKMRTDIGTMAYSLVDGASGEAMTVVPSQKMAMKVPQAMIDQAVKKISTNGVVGAPKLTPTGRKDSISGYACEEYTTEYAGSKATLGLSKDVPNYKEILGSMKSAGAAFRKNSPSLADSMNIDEYPGYPVRSINDVHGQTFTTTVTKINADPIPDSEFAVPTDYKLMEMPSMPAAK